LHCNIVFQSPWFQLVEKHITGWSAPHYSLRANDYVTVVAVTAQGRLLLVRQYRPAVEAVTLELPSGHVDPGETPEQAARKELWEETGHVAEHFECLGQLAPDVGRMNNSLWCFFAGGTVPSADHQPEPGIETVLFPGHVRDLLVEKEFYHALNLAALLLAIARGKLSLPQAGAGHG
jgi:ADP-ribose pyrophosphatase